jgi:hypothetical protein
MFNHRIKIQQAAEKEARRQAGIDKRRGRRKKRLTKWDRIYAAMTDREQEEADYQYGVKFDRAGCDNHLPGHE